MKRLARYDSISILEYHDPSSGYTVDISTRYLEAALTNSCSVNKIVSEQNAISVGDKKKELWGY